MILGSKIAHFVDGVWACEYLEEQPRPDFSCSEDIKYDKTGTIMDIAYAIDNISKTKAVLK